MDARLHIEIQRRMLRIRKFEERAAKAMKRGEVVGGMHVSLGQEGEIVGACMALRDSDTMVGNHRSHGHPIAKGADVKALMAELYGKATGICKGKGGSMHLADFSIGSLGESAIVGGTMPVAVGAALSAKMRGTDGVCLCFFGDGASNQGTFHESLNLAAVWGVPVVFLCENNGYAVTTPASFSVAGGSIANRAAGYGIPGVAVDGQDPLAVYRAVSKACERGRAGGGPSLIEAQTYRYHEHAEYGGLEFVPYRSAEEVAEWQARDPVTTFRGKLIADGVLSESEADELEQSVAAEIEEAVRFAKDSPTPDPSTAYTDVFDEAVGVGR